MQDARFRWKQGHILKVNRISLNNQVLSKELQERNTDIRTPYRDQRSKSPSKSISKDQLSQREQFTIKSSNQLQIQYQKQQEQNIYYLPSVTKSRANIQHEQQKQRQPPNSRKKSFQIVITDELPTAKTDNDISKSFSPAYKIQGNRLKTDAADNYTILKLSQIPSKKKTDEREDLISHQERRKIQNKLVLSQGYYDPISDKIQDDRAYLQSLSLKVKMNAKNVDGKELKKYAFLQEKVSCISPKDYINCFKSINRVQQVTSMYDLKPNVLVQMLQTGEKHELSPKFLGIIPKSPSQVKHFESSSTIAKNKNYLEMLMKGVQESEIANKLDLENNMITSANIKTIADNIPQQLIYLNLSNNMIDYTGVIFLYNILKPPYSLQILNLEHNRLGDQGIKQLMMLLQANRTIMTLNISANHITGLSAPYIADYIRKSKILLELYLAFNSINSSNSDIFWKSIGHCSTLRVLDISHNAMGSKNTATPRKIAKILQKPHPSLNHLDISYNQFNEQESIVIAMALAKNHIIYGFHFQGNDINFYVDVNGYLVSRANEKVYLKVPKKKIYVKTEIKVVSEDAEQNQQEIDYKIIDYKIEQYRLSQIKDQDFRQSRRIDSVRALPSQLRTSEDPILRDTCWICDGFQERTFTYIPNVSGSFFSEPIYVHLSFMQYKPQLMIKRVNQFNFRIMCPAQLSVIYFFSNPLLQSYGTAKDQHVIETPPNEILRRERINIEYIGNKHQEIDEFDKPEYLLPYIKMKFKKFEFVNCYQTQLIKTGKWNQTLGRYILNDNKHYTPLIESKPREDQIAYNMGHLLIRKQKALWTVEKSIFNKYLQDSDVLINDCFEFDFNGSKIKKIFKDQTELANLKETLRGYYQYLFRIYKYYASYFTNSTIPCITTSAMSDFINKTSVVDNRKLKISDVDVLFVAANSKDLNYQYVVEKCLVRYQFMEIMVRIAQDKYLKNQSIKQQDDIKINNNFNEETNGQQVVNISEAVRRVFDENKVVQWVNQFDTAQQWRNERFWNEECEKVIKIKNNLLKALFEYASFINPKKSYFKYKWMTQKDLLGLLSQAGFVNESFAEKEIYLAFLLSKMTQIDELNYMKHCQMNQIEFNEVLARISEKLSLLPLACTIEQQEEIGLIERRQQLLYIKLEAFLTLLFDRLRENIQEQRVSRGLKPWKLDDDNENSDSNADSQESSISIPSESYVHSVKQLILKSRNLSPQKTLFINEDEIDEQRDEVPLSPLKENESLLVFDLQNDSPEKSIKSRKTPVQKLRRVVKERRMEDMFSLVTILKYLSKNKVE